MTSVSRQPSSRPAARRWLYRLLLLLGMLAPTLPALGQTQMSPPKPFVIAADTEPDFYLYQWARLVYVEAFRRLGTPVELVTYTLARRSALADQGAIDGEVSRIYAYAETHPELVRVEEALIDFTFSMYSANPKLRAQRLEDLPANAVAEYRRGILMCENTLKTSIPAERLSTITSTEQGIRKLLAGRTDVYCDIDVFVRHALHTGELKGVTQVRKLFDLAALPTYPYLARKHVALAPRLAATLKQMKAEGLFDAYQKQVERQLGWTQ